MNLVDDFLTLIKSTSQKKPSEVASVQLSRLKCLSLPLIAHIITTPEDTMSRDSQLQAAVLAELNWEPSVTAAHIGVAADGGIVTLSGHVETFARKTCG